MKVCELMYLYGSTNVYSLLRDPIIRLRLPSLPGVSTHSTCLGTHDLPLSISSNTTTEYPRAYRNDSQHQIGHARAGKRHVYQSTDCSFEVRFAFV